MRHPRTASRAPLPTAAASIAAAALGSLAASLAACRAEPEPPPFAEVADPQELMLAVIEPAAETYWDAVGFIMDEKEGATEIAPGTEAEWTAVEAAAFVLAESGNLLLLEARAQGRDHWTAMSRSMIDVGRRAVEAARSRDPAAVFEAGGEVYLVCTGCHAVYAAETLRPSHDPGPEPP